jgi:uncharacterized protein (TIGR02452 family)
MGQRTTLKKIAEQTLQDLEAGYFVNSMGEKIAIKDTVQHSVDKSQLYTPADLGTLLAEKPTRQGSSVTSVVRASTIQCLASLYNDTKKIAVLNFASAKSPGGGFLGGSQAQEESLARSSSLYPTLLQNAEYYEANKRSSDLMYTDHLIYSPQVVFFKNDDGTYMSDYVKADVITMPAVNKGALKLVNEEVEQQIDEIMKRRIRYVLAVSEKSNVETLILGAWGCGVFRNDPVTIAGNFRAVLSEARKFAIPQIVFAVIDRDGQTVGAFEKVFA